MSKAQLVLFSWIADTLKNKNTAADIDIETPDGKKKTIKDVLMELAADNPLFEEKIFHISEGKPDQRIKILHNGSLLSSDIEMNIKLNDGDILTILPLAEGG